LKVTAIVSFEIEYDGKVSEEDIDTNDIIRFSRSQLFSIRGQDDIVNLNITTKSVKVG